MDTHFENIQNIVGAGKDYPINFPQLTVGGMHPIQYSCSMSGGNNNNNDCGNIANNSNKFTHNNINNNNNNNNQNNNNNNHNNNNNNSNGNNNNSYNNSYYTNLNSKYISKITNSPRKRIESIRIRPYFIPERLRTKSENAAESTDNVFINENTSNPIQNNFSNFTMMDTSDNSTQHDVNHNNQHNWPVAGTSNSNTILNNNNNNCYSSITGSDININYMNNIGGYGCDDMLSGSNNLHRSKRNVMPKSRSLEDIRSDMNINTMQQQQSYDPTNRIRNLKIREY